MNTKIFLTSAIAMSASIAIAETHVLTVYTYDSFVAAWGPGPAIEAAFEAECDCDLQFVGNGDGAALLARVQLEGSRTDADVVLGLDQNLIVGALQTGMFAAHGIEMDFDLPVAWSDTTFLPYDWGYFAFVGSVSDEMPGSLRALANSDLKIAIQDPRSSTPGLGLLLWVKAAYGDEAADLWTDLADNILTVTPGWSAAYGLFLEGEVDMVLSYTTSPAYHLIVEEDASKTSALFSEGHYLQVEVAGVLKNTDQPELARQFLEFMVSEAVQSILPTTNWMYPAITPEGGLPAGFETLTIPDKALMFSPEEAQAIKAEALAEWQAALSQ